MRRMSPLCFSLVLVVIMTVAASGQSFQVQCPTSTITHPTAANNNSEPAYTGPTAFARAPRGISSLQRMSTVRSNASRFRAAMASRPWAMARRPTCLRLARCPD